MKTNKTAWLAAGLVAVLAGSAARSYAATNPAYLNINVTISNNLSVTVDTLATSTQTVTWTGTPSLVAAATATVTNDSGYISERWQLTTRANAFDATSGAAGWTIAGTEAADTVKLQAVFGPAGVAEGVCSGAIWSNATAAPALTSATQTQYTQTVLADTLTSAGAYQPDIVSSNRVSAGTTRALCWKLTMPTSTALTGTQVVPVIVTAF